MNRNSSQVCVLSGPIEFLTDRQSRLSRLSERFRRRCVGDDRYPGSNWCEPPDNRYCALAPAGLIGHLFAGGDTVPTMGDDTASAWTQVLDEMTAVSSELSADGWETLASPAGDTGLTAGDDGSLDPGFVHVIPDDDADTFAEWFVPDGFKRTEVYRATTPEYLYLLTVLFDDPSERALLVAGAVDRGSLPACRRAAEEVGHVHTHVRRLDGTHLGSFRHADPDAFFPE